MELFHHLLKKCFHYLRTTTNDSMMTKDIARQSNLKRNDVFVKFFQHIKTSSYAIQSNDMKKPSTSCEICREEKTLKKSNFLFDSISCFYESMKAKVKEK